VSVVSVSRILVTVCADSLKASPFVLRISLLTLVPTTGSSSVSIANAVFSVGDSAQRTDSKDEVFSESAQTVTKIQLTLTTDTDNSLGLCALA
jgi:hypothetical protein